jgi:hypothetical protein
MNPPPLRLEEVQMLAWRARDVNLVAFGREAFDQGEEEESHRPVDSGELEDLGPLHHPS